MRRLVGKVAHTRLSAREHLREIVRGMWWKSMADMRHKYLRLGILFTCLIGSAVAYVGVGMRLFGQYQVAYATYRNSCNSLITWSPPAQLYSALYVNQPSLVTLRYRSPTPDLLQISLSVPNLTQTQQVQVAAGPTFAAKTFKPPILSSAALDALVGPRQRDGQIHLVVRDRHGIACDTTVPVVLKSRQWMHWQSATGDDLSPYLVGWVTPQAPVISKLIGNTADWVAQHPEAYPDTTALNGYDQGNATAEQVRAQVNALFDTLQFAYHLHYAEDNVPFDRDQIVQLPQDILSMQNPTGMCVETTVILASAVERLGMRPYLIMVPGHMFLGVALGSDPSAPIEYWETSDLNGGISGAQAQLHGNAEYAAAQSAGTILRVLDVSAERGQGIQPIE